MPLIAQSPIMIAKKDIFVYKLVKVVDNKICSPFRQFVWEPGRIYHVPELKFDHDNLIYDGFHAYYFKNHTTIFNNKKLFGDLIYAFMRIPEGSKCVHGLLGHIVSDSMAYEKLLYE